MNDFFERYFEMCSDYYFIKLCKTLSYELNNVLGRNLKEVETVKEWIKIFNSTPPVTISGVSASFNSLFVHGYNHSDHGSFPSGVEFDYLNNLKENRELADIIFITSIYDQGRKILEKISLNQAKWGAKTSWLIKKEQLYLLSRFPRFRGIVGSLVPLKDYYIEDFSKGLGSYGLMNTENFIYISANYLLNDLGGKGTINLKDFKNYNKNERFSSYYRFYPYDLLDSALFCNTTYSFVADFLSGRVGEIVHGEERFNSQAKGLLNDILSSLISQKNKSTRTGYNDNITNFLDGYNTQDLRFDNSDISLNFEGGMGIIQLKLDLSKE